EHPLVERNLSRSGGRQVGQGCLRESRRWCIDRLGGRDDILDRFVVYEEEELVLLDRTTKRRSPIIVVGKRPRGLGAGVIVKPVIGIQGPAGPLIQNVAVVLVCARLGNVVDLGAGLLAVLSRVCVADDGGFLQFVLAQSQVGSTRVIQVQVRIHVVLAVDRKQVGGGGKAVRAEVAITLARVHGYAGRGLSYVGEVIAAVRLVLNDVLVEIGGQVGIVCLHQGRSTGDFHRLRAGAHYHLDVGNGRLANVNAELAFRLDEALGGHADGVAPRAQQRKPVGTA